MIYANILADSYNPAANSRLTTMEVEYPLYIHNEIMTHRMFSRNSASSRAIPVEKRLSRVLSDPVVPTVWPKNEPGMSATEELTGAAKDTVEGAWYAAMRDAVASARVLMNCGVHKQIANRVVEPWCWMKTIISATEWENFFVLRTAKDAHPDLQELAYQMLRALMESTPAVKQVGQWHIPFGDKLHAPYGTVADVQGEEEMQALRLKVSVARCARISYLTHDGVLDVRKDVAMHDERLLPSRHMSPFEHQAYALEQPERVGNFVGWKQYRYTISGHTRSCGLRKLYEQLVDERSSRKV